MLALLSARWGAHSICSADQESERLMLIHWQKDAGEESGSVAWILWNRTLRGWSLVTGVYMRGVRMPICGWQEMPSKTEESIASMACPSWQVGRCEHVIFSRNAQQYIWRRGRAVTGLTQGRLACQILNKGWSTRVLKLLGHWLMSVAGMKEVEANLTNTEPFGRDWQS